ncbi:MAG: lysophospholipid acyltransferase family protein, partial [Candidatus Omnitrophota bacterium]
MKQREKQTDLFVYLLVRIIVWLPRRLFRIILSVSVYLLAANNTPARKSIRYSLGLGFPEMPAATKRQLTQKIIYQNGFLVYESGNLNRRWVQKSVEAKGLVNLEEALAKGKGVIALSAHLGNFALLLSYLSRRYPVKAVVNDPKNHYMARNIRDIRQKSGIIEIPKKPATASVQESLNWLKSGKVLLLLADEYRKKGITVPFFNLPSGTQAAPAVFSRRLGCAVVPVSIVRRGPKHLIRVEPALVMGRSEDQEKDVRDN